MFPPVGSARVSLSDLQQNETSPGCLRYYKRLDRLASGSSHGYCTLLSEKLRHARLWAKYLTYT